MGLAKSELFTAEQNEIASIAKVISHPARVAILQHIIKSKTCICGDLVEVIGLAQPTISQHLKELKASNLIQGTIEGTRVCYCINNNTWLKFSKIITAFFNQTTQTAICC